MDVYEKRRMQDFFFVCVVVRLALAIFVGVALPGAVGIALGATFLLAGLSWVKNLIFFLILD